MVTIAARPISQAARVAVGVFVSLALPQPAPADPNLNCNAYAGAAVAQNQQNIAQKCGFSGGAWLSDIKPHFDWCAAPATTMAHLVAEDTARQNALIECANRAVQAQQACQSYAQQAVGAATAAQSNSCGFGGGRWGSDYAVHFNWCLTAPQSSRDQETAARANQLAGCISAKQAAADQAKRDACAKYSATAVGQQSENESRQCGFSGGRWTGDFFAHFNWCMGVGPEPADQETSIRVAALTNDCMMRVCTTREEASIVPPFFQSTTSCRNVPKPAR
jgi:hypothetical protein